MKQAKQVFKDHTQATVLPTTAAERKAIPIFTGCLDYFPNALAEVAKISKQGNDQHNPGEPLHWARGKSMDHADTIIRHLMERGTVDVDGTRHSAKAAWRALALLQEELEAAGAPLSRGSWPAEKPTYGKSPMEQFQSDLGNMDTFKIGGTE
jgi:hypothetical protein